jgi:short-subunit dehydrogenase
VCTTIGCGEVRASNISQSILDNFTTAPHCELRGSRVYVSVVRAGPVLTEFCHAAAARPAGLPLPTERMGVTAETVAWRVWDLLQRPRRVIYVPSWLTVVPWVEASFGWLIDRLGPLLLREK